MQVTEHPSIQYATRYAKAARWDKFTRDRIFVEECQKYSRVLETGCSTGFLSSLIAHNGTRVVGLEIDPSAASAAESKCSRVIVADLGSSDWTNGIGETFNLITFGDVLEHLPSPLPTLRQSKELLASGGRILICLPNIAHFSTRLKLLIGRFRYEEMGTLDRTHLRFFTPETAEELIRDAGCRIIKSDMVIGGRIPKPLRHLWHLLAKLLPGFFAYQMMFLIEPIPESVRPAIGQA